MKAISNHIGILTQEDFGSRSDVLTFEQFLDGQVDQLEKFFGNDSHARY